MVKCWHQPWSVDAFSISRQCEVTLFGESQGTMPEDVGLNKKPVIFGFIAWSILDFRWSGGKNDRNGPYAFIFMGILNFMGMPDNELCSNWSAGLILDIGVWLYYRWIFIFKHCILINFVYSYVLKYCALNVLPLFAIIWSRHLLALLWFTHVNGMGQGNLFPTFLPN